jgi:hypothetical protein
MSDDFPAELRTFLAENIESVAQLELLLLLRREPEKSWTIAAAAQTSYMAEEMTAVLLGELCADGLLGTTAQGDYRYAPRTPELAKLVDELATVYSQRRVTVIGIIHSAPVDKLRRFADAFRLRKPKEES